MAQETQQTQHICWFQHGSVVPQSCVLSHCMKRVKAVCLQISKHCEHCLWAENKWRLQVFCADVQLVRQLLKLITISRTNPVALRHLQITSVLLFTSLVHCWRLLHSFGWLGLWIHSLLNEIMQLISYSWWSTCGTQNACSRNAEFYCRIWAAHDRDCIMSCFSVSSLRWYFVLSVTCAH